jgi:hypothetical protein
MDMYESDEEEEGVNLCGEEAGEAPGGDSGLHGSSH